MQQIAEVVGDGYPAQHQVVAFEAYTSCTSEVTAAAAVAVAVLLADDQLQDFLDAPDLVYQLMPEMQLLDPCSQDEGSGPVHASFLAVCLVQERTVEAAESSSSPSVQEWTRQGVHAAGGSRECETVHPVQRQ